MKRIFLLVGFFALATANSVKYETIQLQIPENVENFNARAEALRNMQRNGRIQGGSPVENDLDFPFVVEVTTQTTSGMFTCTGSIINTRFVITARECVRPSSGLSPVSISTSAGTSSRDGLRQTLFTVLAHYVTTGTTTQPNFALLNVNDDFLIAFLPSIETIRLPTATQAVSTFDLVTAFYAGWGTTGTGSATRLNAANGTIASQFECTPSVVPALVTEFQLCIRDPTPPNTVTLDSGDLGGPVFLIETDGLPTLIGILERTAGTTIGDSINLFFRIGNFWNFIHDTAGVTRRP